MTASPTTVLAALLLVLVTAGCKVDTSQVQQEPVVNLSPPAQTQVSITGPPVRFRFSDSQGSLGDMDLRVGAPVPAASVNDAGVQACVDYANSRGQATGWAVPLKATVSLSSGAAASLDLHQTAELSGGTAASNFNGPEWGETFADVPGHCVQGNDGGRVSFDAGSSHRQSWAVYVVIPGNPTDEALVGSVLLAPPTLHLGARSATGELQRPLASAVVSCGTGAESGRSLFIALDVRQSLDLGCTSPTGVASQHDRYCAEAYPAGGSQQVNGVMVDDRTLSLYQVCTGFGAPEGVQLSPAVHCALVAALATADPVTSRTVDTLCKAESVAQAYQSGDWAGAAGGATCDYLGEVFAAGVGVAVAGATVETGAGVALGIGTYKALKVGLSLACSGVLDGGAAAVGAYLEGRHETKVMGDVIHKGKCLGIDSRGDTSFVAVQCP